MLGKMTMVPNSSFLSSTGETIHNMLKLEKVLVDENERPLYPPKMRKTEILNNPFPDIIPRIIVQKNFNLLSFGEQAEEDEEESVILNKKFSGKGKSAHDHLTDPKLSSQLAVELLGLANEKRKEDCNSDWESVDEVKTQEELEVIKKEKELVYCLHYNYVIEKISIFPSFSEEAEEDEKESAILNKKFSGKNKSAHDHLSDPKLCA
ncbi:Peptidyl-prolyl cis-trans isomerase CWC27 like protein [Eufriesea mexicana]|nr:Peptidyl-prolyl cis-trans isomerase CWC27 like protein [Eufriesea mexicana]